VLWTDKQTNKQTASNVIPTPTDRVDIGNNKNNYIIIIYYEKSHISTIFMANGVKHCLGLHNFWVYEIF